MNRFGDTKNATQYQQVVKENVKRGTRENERAMRDTRGAPEQKFSIERVAGEKGEYEKCVVLDTDLFDGISPRNWGRALGNFVYKNLAGAKLNVYDEAGNAETVYIAKENDRVKKDGAKNSHKIIDKLAGYRGDSIRAQSIVQMSEVLEISRHKENTSEHSHQWLDENGWIIRTAYLQDREGNIYEATLNIADGRNGKILYEINRVHKIDITKNLGKHTDTGEGQRSRYQEPGPGGTQSEVEGTGGIVSSTENGRNLRESGNFMNSLLENDSYVKQKFSFDDEDYMLAVRAGDKDAAQEMVDEAAQKTGSPIIAVGIRREREQRNIHTGFGI